VVKFHRRENKWESSVQTTEIYPYYKNDLESMLKAVGFKKLEFYRNFNFEDYDKNGTDLIIIAEKKGVLKSSQKRKPFTDTRSAKAKPAASKSVAKKGVTVSKPRGRPSKPPGR
jgi:hypothetical protein